jgi:hypothetical protein
MHDTPINFEAQCLQATFEWLRDRLLLCVEEVGFHPNATVPHFSVKRKRYDFTVYINDGRAVASAYQNGWMVNPNEKPEEQTGVKSFVLSDPGCFQKLYEWLTSKEFK